MQASKVRNYVILIVFIALNGGFVFCATDLFSEQKVVIPECDFANIRIGDTLKKEVIIQNPSRQPIQIVGANVPCGCTSVEGLPKTIPAGQRESILVLFKGTTAGQQTTEIVLFTNNPQQTTVSLTVRGDVKAINE